MDLREIEKEINRLKEHQNNRLEVAYRLDEKKIVLNEVIQEMLMLEHREDINNFKSRWEELKDYLDKRKR